MGRLTRDPEVRYSANTQLANARFSVAVDRRLSKEKRMEAENNNQPTADFINCVAFEHLFPAFDTFHQKDF